MAEYIKATRSDWWICICGNQADQEGFYPCDQNGMEVQPTPEAWTGTFYICDRCKRIIDSRNLAVVGQR